MKHDEPINASTIGITLLITGIILFAVLLIGSSVGIISLNILTEEKTKDTWGIVYLSLERELGKIKELISTAEYRRTDNDLNPETLKNNPPTIIIKENDKDSFIELRGNLGPPKGLEGFDKIINRDRSIPYYLWMISGESYFVKEVSFDDQKVTEHWPYGPGKYLLMWRANSQNWIKNPSENFDNTLLYIVTSQGQLVFTSDERVTALNINQRSLVKAFIEAPLTQAQIELNQGNMEIHGVFNEIPDTNLVIFFEVPVAITLGPVRNLMYTFVIILISSLAITFLVIQWPIRKLTDPLRTLVKQTRLIGSGSYQIKIAPTAIKEVNILNQAFQKMAINLEEKDHAINRYIEKQKEAFRLQSELNVAHNIQENLHTSSPLPQESGLELAVRYKPADECAGDWYNYHFDESSQETVIAIADVSGHGAGSAMFTAMIAAIFKDIQIQNPGRFPAQQYLKRLNKVFQNIGKNDWHTTFCLAQYTYGSSELTITTAGFTPILMTDYDQDLEQYNTRSLVLSSDLIGIVDEPELNIRTINISSKSLITFFTDGLTEAENIKGKQFGTKRLKKSINKVASHKPESIIRNVLQDWKDFCNNHKQEDDFCIVSIRKSS